MYVRTYVCMYECIYVHMFVCMYERMYVFLVILTININYFPTQYSIICLRNVQGYVIYAVET
jgi:hypothetical protein